jgi:MFS family permease
VGLAALVHSPNIAAVASLCFVIGCGLGLSALPSLIAAQSSVDWHERGVVTGTHMFARSLGSAVGVAVFGAIANTVFGEGDVSSVGPAAIRSGTAAVFLGVLVVAGIAATAVMAMPPTPPERQQASSDG